MAFQHKTDIMNGNIISASHIFDIINALDGTCSNDTDIFGRTLSGSTVCVSTIYVNDVDIEEELVTGVSNVVTGDIVELFISTSTGMPFSTSFDVGGGSGAGFPFTGSAIISGSLILTG